MSAADLWRREGAGGETAAGGGRYTDHLAPAAEPDLGGRHGRALGRIARRPLKAEHLCAGGLDLGDERDALEREVQDHLTVHVRAVVVHLVGGGEGETEQWQARQQPSA